MATFERRTGHQHPPRVKELIKSIKKAQKKVKRLRNRLKTAKIERGILRTEWVRYKESTAAIRRCPPEILSMIFRFYVALNPRVVRRLLLVCKQWYNVAVNDPRLWNRIVMSLGGDWDLKSVTDSINRRNELFMQRSGTLLLDLDIDFGKLLSPAGQIVETIQSFLPIDMEGYEGLNDWLDDLEIESGISSFTERCQLYHAYSVIDKLIGQHGEAMVRWGSLHLRCPEYDEEVSLDLWCRMHWPTPNLTRLAVAIQSFHRYLQDDEPTCGLPNLSAVKHLEVDYATDLHRLSINRGSIESMVVHQGVAIFIYYNLSQFACLESLKIQVEWDGSGNLGLPEELITLTLPRLRQLILSGDVKHLDLVKFEVPVLQEVIFQNRRSEGEEPVFPNVQSANLQWAIEGARVGDWSDASLRVEMRLLLIHFGKAQHFTVPNFARIALWSTLRQLNRTKKLSPVLKTVTFERAHGEAESCDVQAFILSPTA